MKISTILFFFCVLTAFTGAALAGSCILPDNGSGTINLPPECPDGFEGPMSIVDGFPPGTTVEIQATLTDFTGVTRGPGGSLGGEIQVFDATLYWVASGTGTLAGFNRSMAIPVHCVIHTGPRNPGDPVQTFAGELMEMDGQLFGDPDFCELIVRAGTNNGLPSPGSFTLTELPSGDYAVDSFFDITYEIEFEGCPASPLDELAGTTQSTDRFQAGGFYTDHSCVLPDNGGGTIDLPPDCPDGFEGEMIITEGLYTGSTIEIDATLTDYSSIVRTAGGTLGGEILDFDAALHWVASGTGMLAGFNRSMAIPVHCVIHTGPRNPGDPVQTFAGELMEMDGQLFGDPDFCELIVRAGTNSGLPSPGAFTLTELPSGDYAVDSFFDITYEIEFEGCPGSPLDDLAGTTQGTDRFRAGEYYTVHPCVLPDNGSETVDLPADCPYGYRGEMIMVDGLPTGSTIEIDATLTDYSSIVRTAGGTLGGEVQDFDATLYWIAAGTGSLSGFERLLSIPVHCVVHTAPRIPGDSVQVFASALTEMTGELFGDPDFCTLRIRAGSTHSLPSPGGTVLTELPSGDYAVDSFFDITYEIEFEGCPASPLDDAAGTTQATSTFTAGEDVPVSVAAGERIPARKVHIRNIPNPFNPFTTIKYEVTSPGGLVTVDIYDVRGRVVKSLVFERAIAGERSVVWDGRNDADREVSSGVYFSVLRAGAQKAVARMVLLK